MAISFDRSTKTFYLDGRSITYAFTVNSYGYAEHLYFGKKISHDPLFFTRGGGMGDHEPLPPEVRRGYASYDMMWTECSFHGTGDYREPCVLVENAAGDRLSDLLFAGYEILSEKPRIPGMPSSRGGETLVLHLADKFTAFSADLYYTVWEDEDVIARRAVYRNGADTPAKLRRAYSFSLSLPGQEYDAISFYGGWARERTPERTPIGHHVYAIDSKRCSSSASLNPFLVIAGRHTDEDRGEAIGVSLVYSSSFVLKAQGTGGGDTLLTGGVNDFDFGYHMEPGEEFYTPEVLLAYSDEGLGGMSRAMHDLLRDHLIQPRYVKSSRPLLLNNWEGTTFHFTYEKLAAIVDAVKGTGIDTFVLDDGWFGKREDPSSGLGDWFVNEQKLEGGLDRLIEHVHGAGMKFGLWFEPEMISEDSEIYRAHPDYAIGVPGRDHCRTRQQLMMDLTRADVRDYIADSVNKILHSHQIDYVKWDYNRDVTEQYTLGLPPERQSEFAYRFALGVYDLFERIVEGNPDIFFEGCASGGARFDPAVLAYFPQIWTSDDSDAEERTKIQTGTSYAYPLSSMACHLSSCPNHQTGRTESFATRADIAHLGATGYELDSTKLTEEEIAAIREQTAEYREMEDLILFGDLYRIDDPFTGNYFSEAIVSKDKSRAYLIAYRRLGGVNSEAHRVKMRGLDPKKNYFVPELSLILSGATLMNVGLIPNFGGHASGDFRTAKFHFEEK